MIRSRWFGWFAGLVLLGILSGPALIAVLALRQPNSVALPEPSGPYAVGRIIAAWRDDARVDPFAPVAGTKRELPVWIWYPAARGAVQPRVEYMPALVRQAMQPHPPLLLRLTVLPLTTDRANVTAHALDAPPLLAEHSTFPVVVLKPALGAAVVQSSVLAEDLASHGYVVVGSDSPHTTPGVAYPDGRIVMQTPAGHPSENAPGPISDLAPGQPNDFYLPVLETWVQDNRFILDRLHALNDMDPAGRFTHRLDLASVGALGHSFGGATALQFCREDSRCKTGIDLDGMTLGDVNRRGVGKPFLFLFADRPLFDDLTPDEQGRIFLGALRRIRESIPERPSLLLLHGAQHYNFFDQALLMEPTIPRWFGATGSLDQTRVLLVTRRYVRAFFDTHLKGARDRLLDGPSPDFPEMRFVRDVR
jgi:hypothetical protein